LIIQILDNTDFSQNTHTIFFTKDHLICSYLAAVCNGITVSTETAQMILDQYQGFRPHLFGRPLSDPLCQKPLINELFSEAVAEYLQGQFLRSTL